MEETRVSRYQEYRESFIKEGSIVSDGQTNDEMSATTSTLPMKEVINAIHHEEENVALAKRLRKKRIIKIVVEVSVVILLIAGLVILGIFAWR